MILPFAYLLGAIGFAVIGVDISNQWNENNRQWTEQRAPGSATTSAIAAHLMAERYAKDDDPDTSPQDAADDQNQRDAELAQKFERNQRIPIHIHTQVKELGENDYCAVATYSYEDIPEKTVVEGADSVQECLQGS
jgi:hypothetical protein